MLVEHMFMCICLCVRVRAHVCIPMRVCVSLCTYMHVRVCIYLGCVNNTVRGFQEIVYEMYPTRVHLSRHIYQK